MAQSQLQEGPSDSDISGIFPHLKPWRISEGVDAVWTHVSNAGETEAGTAGCSRMHSAHPGLHLKLRDISMASTLKTV